MKPADRTWEMFFLGEWVRIKAMGETLILLETGMGVLWATEPGSSLPAPGIKTRYTVPVPDPEGSLVPMPWRAGKPDLVMLAQDSGHPEVGEAIRRRLA